MIVGSCRHPETGGLWTPYASNPVISPGAGEGHTSFPCCFPDGVVYHAFYWYNVSGVNKIGHATADSPLGPYTKDTAHNPVLNVGSGWEGTGVNVPMAWKEGSTWYMIYRGQASDGALKLGLATASAPEGPWTKSGSNPVLVGTEAWELDTNGKSSIDFTGVIKVGSTYYIYYNSVAVGQARQIGYATSTDLVSWTKGESNPTMHGGRFCPGVFKYGGYYYWVSPHYGIGTDYTYFELWRSLSPTMTNLEMCRIVKRCGATGAWDQKDEDTPQIITTDIQRTSFPNDTLYVIYAGCSASDVWSSGIIYAEDIDAAVAML